MGYSKQIIFSLVSLIINATAPGSTACSHVNGWGNNANNAIKPRARDYINQIEHDEKNTKLKDYNDQEGRRNKMNDFIQHFKANYHKLSPSDVVGKEDHRKDNRETHKQGRKLKKYHESKRQANNRRKPKLAGKSKGNRKTSEEESQKGEKENQEYKELDITFPKTYHATGLITLPYDGIMEPFEVWYAKEVNMSRIDYYHGVDKTFQRGDLEEYGVYIKEIPMHKTKVGDNNKNSKSCWYEAGRKYDVVKPQSIVPMDLSRFKIISNEYKSGTLTIKLRRHLKTGNLKNTYTLWVSKEKPHRPIRYEIEGFDTLLKGYYDHYYLDYITFNDWYFDFSIMEIPKG